MSVEHLKAALLKRLRRVSVVGHARQTATGRAIVRPHARYLLKHASITLLTGQMGAGKTTLSGKLQDRYDAVHHTDIGSVDPTTGKYVIPEGADKKRAIQRRIHEILKDHRAGKRVLLDGYPKSMEDEYRSVLPHVHKVLHLDHGPIRSNVAVVRRSFQRGSSPIADLRYALSERSKIRRALDKIRAIVGHDKVQVIGRDYAEKTAEFAPGIPDRKRVAPITEPAGRWTHVEQQHDALRAGRHIDLRLAHGADAHSWAVRRMPEPGEQVLAKQQPTHTRRYMDFQGTIGPGYGAGTVKRLRGGHVDVVEATPRHIAYNIYQGKKAHEYTLTQVGKDTRDWLLRNRSTTPGKYSIPRDKPHYRSAPYSEELADRPGVLQPKVDGAHSIVLISADRRPRVFSYRDSKKGDVLEYTHKIPGLFNQKVPKGTPTMVLRAETFLSDAKGRALPAQQTAGILNSSIEKARAGQHKGRHLQVMPFDIVGSKLPYEERLRRIAALTPRLRGFVAPEVARTPAEKRRLVERIRSKTHPITREGVVHWSHEGEPTKAKIVSDTDVYLHSVFAGKGKHKGRAGGYTYAHSPGGTPVGRVGTGLSDRERATLWRNREKLRDRVAKVTFDRRTHKDALYAPRHTGWHVEKNQP